MLKYIVFGKNDLEIIVAFSNLVEHATISDSLKIDKDKLISAGFVSSNFQCFGYSRSLDIGSREKEDTELLRFNIEKP